MPYRSLNLSMTSWTALSGSVASGWPVSAMQSAQPRSASTTRASLTTRSRVRAHLLVEGVEFGRGVPLAVLEVLAVDVAESPGQAAVGRRRIQRRTHRPGDGDLTVTPPDRGPTLVHVEPVHRVVVGAAGFGRQPVENFGVGVGWNLSGELRRVDGADAVTPPLGVLVRRKVEGLGILHLGVDGVVEGARRTRSPATACRRRCSAPGGGSRLPPHPGRPGSARHPALR